MEPIVTPFKYDVLKWVGPDAACDWEAETFLPARETTGPANKPVHFNKNVFVDALDDNAFVVKIQTRTTVWHAYEGVLLDPGTYRFTAIVADYEYIPR